MKRFFDFFGSFFALIIFFPLILLIALLVKVSSDGEIIYWSSRVGQNNIIFRMPKFRTMRMNTPQLATHLLADSNQYLIPIGSFLRKSSLDELPQLWSIFVGDMSFVGPRPALFNQEDLISERTKLRVHLLKPGLTGWAQINGRDEISIQEKVELDFEYMERQSFLLDLKILFLTVFKVFYREGISH
jgi:O-antigen biosynthesis protein WbqP